MLWLNNGRSINANDLYKVRFNALYTLLGTFNLTDKKNKNEDIKFIRWDRWEQNSLG